MCYDLFEQGYALFHDVFISVSQICSVLFFVSNTFLTPMCSNKFQKQALIFLNWKDLRVAEKLHIQYKEIIFPKPYKNELPNLSSNTYRCLMYFLHTGSSLT